MSKKVLLWQGLNISFIVCGALIGFLIIQEKLSMSKLILKKVAEVGWKETGDQPDIQIDIPEKKAPVEINEQYIHQMEKRVSVLGKLLLPITVFGGVIGYLIAWLLKRIIYNLTAPIA